MYSLRVISYFCFTHDTNAMHMAYRRSIKIVLTI